MPGNQFCRIHRCYIVALKSISRFNHDNVHINGKQFSIGEQYRKIFFDRIITLEGEPSVKPDMTTESVNEFGIKLKEAGLFVCAADLIPISSVATALAGTPPDNLDALESYDSIETYKKPAQ
ncbi:MAG: hypothetical protein WDO71_19415 [Bacteroidota bacterium]